MGVFDYVTYSCDCPSCGAPIKEFQTKDGDPYLNTVEPWTVREFHAFCDGCKACLRFDAVPVEVRWEAKWSRYKWNGTEVAPTTFQPSKPVPMGPGGPPPPSRERGEDA